ncbi:MAG: glycosyltransferase family 4 protein [Solirubrobacteraceae bacterium]
MPVPYREELFQRLAAHPQLELEVIYQAGSQASWDQDAGWFPAQHAYDARHLRPRHLARRGRSPITWPSGLERALRAFDPDVVAVSEFGPATLRALAWARARRRALVVLTEVTPEAQRALSRPQRLVHRTLARRADGLIAVSSPARQRLLALGAHPARVSVSLQPVAESALLAAAATRRAVELEPVEVLAVARLVPDKELSTLIGAFAQAQAQGGAAGTRLRIVGGGPLEAELRAQARRSGVLVSFEGALGPGQLPARYAQAGVFALPSRYEPFGVALREAVVCGLPVIASAAVGAVADFAREGENAILVPPRDERALARALQRVCRDPELRRRMGAASSAIAARRTLELDVEAFAARIVSAARISSAAPAARARR